MDPLVLSLHGSLLELSLRVTRLEREVNVPDGPRATFGRGPGYAPTPDYGPQPTVAEPCSCDESLALRARVQELLAKLDEVSP